MKSFRLCLLALGLLAGGMGKGAAAERVIVQAQFETFDAATKSYWVRLPERRKVEFSPASDSKALAALLKVAGSWLLQPLPAGVTSEIRLKLTMASDTAAKPAAGDRLIVALKEWKLEMPIVIDVEGSEQDEFLADRFLVESPELLFTGILTAEEQQRFIRLEPARVADFERERESPAAFNSLLRVDRATPEVLAALKTRTGNPSGTPEGKSKILQQIEELRAALAGVEAAAGGCEVSSVVRREHLTGLEITAPSLTSPGKKKPNLEIWLVRALPPSDRASLVAQSKQQREQWQAMAEQAKVIRRKVNAGDRSLADEEKALREKMRPLGTKLLAFDQLPYARFKDLGLIITPPLAEPGDPAPTPTQRQAWKSFYTQLDRIAKFYDPADINLLADFAPEPH